jgi:hypothetical protein
MLLWYNKQIRERKLLKEGRNKGRQEKFLSAVAVVQFEILCDKPIEHPSIIAQVVQLQRVGAAISSPQKTGPPLIIVVEFYLANNPPRLKKKNS